MAGRPETLPQLTSETSPLVLGLDIGTTTITCLAWGASEWPGCGGGNPRQPSANHVQDGT